MGILAYMLAAAFVGSLASMSVSTAKERWHKYLATYRDAAKKRQQRLDRVAQRAAG